MIAGGALLITAMVIGIAPRLWTAANAHEELPLVLPEFEALAQRTYVYDVYGNEIAVYELENSQPIKYADISPEVIEAFLVVEDKEFFSHHGINLRSLVRATLSNFASDAPQQGASTITMQVVKNDFLAGLERDGRYKLLQIHYARMLEREMPKEQILERYLNTVFFGNNAYGIQAAAETYFGKTAAELTFIESAFLAGLVRSPSGFDPINSPERSRARWLQVLDRLVSEGYLTEVRGRGARDRRSCCPNGSKTIPTRTNVRSVLHRGAARLPAQHVDDARRHVRGAVQPAVPRWPADPHDARPEPAGAGRGGPQRAAGERCRDSMRRSCRSTRRPARSGSMVGGRGLQAERARDEHGARGRARPGRASSSSSSPRRSRPERKPAT